MQQETPKKEQDTDKRIHNSDEIANFEVIILATGPVDKEQDTDKRIQNSDKIANFNAIIFATGSVDTAEAHLQEKSKKEQDTDERFISCNS